MSWCWFEPASAVRTIWGYCPRRSGGSPLRQGERPAVSAAEGSPMFALPRNFQPRASSSGFWSPAVPQCRRPGMPNAAAASRDPGRITGNSTGVPGPDFQRLEPTSPLQSTVTKNAPVSPLESALTQLLDLKSPGMNTYKKVGVGWARCAQISPPPWLRAPYAQRR